MATKPSKPALTASELAKLMGEMRMQINTLEEVYGHYAKDLLATLQREGRKREGPYTRSQRQTLKVTDSTKAEEWAKEHYCFKVDTSKAMRIIRREFSVPSGFKVEVSEYLTSRTSKEEETQE